MIVIVDMGATKADWSFADGSTVIDTIQTKGFNPYFYDAHQIIDLLKKDFDDKDFKAVSAVYMYGAGCSTPNKNTIVRDAIEHYFPQAQIEVNHDLLASARALCGHNPGIACILGTGSNSCLYDGTNVVSNNPSLGFLLGDEGSGGDLGRELIKAYYYGELTEGLNEEFEKHFNTDPVQLLDSVYSSDSPNAYCASFTPFLNEHKEDASIQKLIEASFSEFFNRHVSSYENYQILPINFVGSVAYHFKPILEKVAKQHGCFVGTVIKAPVGKLIEFHSKID